MKHHRFREIAKLLAGFILADFFLWWWVAASGLLPITVWGMALTTNNVLPALIFDLALFIILVHYGWHIGKTPALSGKTYLYIVGTITGVIAIVHLVRVFTGSDFEILGWYMPIYLSWIGVIVAGYLSYMSFRLASRGGTKK